MDMIATLRPWAFVLLAIWLIMWAVMGFVDIKNPVYKGIMAVLAIVAGILMLISG